MCFGCTSRAVLQVNSEYPEHTKPTDLTAKFPAVGRTRMQLVADHLLGKDYLLGGNIADYNTDSGVYQMFLIKEKDATKAENLLLSWKATHSEAIYLLCMGGYYEPDNGTPVYMFVKGVYVAGVVGLDANGAGIESRRFARCVSSTLRHLAWEFSDFLPLSSGRSAPAC
jgi:hypothetical protein